MFKTISKLFLCSLIIVSSIAAQKSTTLRLQLKEKQLPFGLIAHIPSNTPHIGLALSGGGARSISHVGVLKAFEEENIPIDIIVGTSMGSVVGGLYSAGYNLTDIDSILNNTQWEDFYSAQQSTRRELFIDQKVSEDRAILSFRLDGFKLILPTSISTGQRAANFLNLVALNAPIQAQESFDHYRFKYRAISTDLITGQEVILDKGLLGMAMRASSSVSFVLPPVKKDSMLLVDGGLVANVPVKETRDLGANIVVAVNCSSPLYTEDKLIYPWIIADQIVSIPMKILNTRQIETADYVITPPLDSITNSDFSNLPEVIKRGYNSAKPIASHLRKDIELKIRNSFDNKNVFYKNIVAEDGQTKNFLEQFGSKDSVSSNDMLYALYNMQNEGSWKSLSIDVTEQDGKTKIKLNAEENPLVTNFNINGVSLVNKSALVERLAHLSFKPFSAQRTFFSALDILRYYKEQGFSLTKIKNISFNDSTHILTLDFSEGLISKITIEGNLKTKEKIITSSIPLKEGDYFRYSLAEEGLTNLRSTNLFDEIELSTIEHDGQYELKLDVHEKISSVIRLGMRIDNEYYTQGTLDIRDENFNGTGAELGVILSGGTRNASMILEQRANRVFDSYLTYKIRAFGEFKDIAVYKDDSTSANNEFSRSKIGEYRQIFYGGTFGFGAQVEKFGNVFVEARYQRDEVKDRSNYSGSTYKLDISSIKFSLSLDSQNDYPYPTSGFFVNAFYETAQTALGGNIGYTKFFIDYKTILTLHSSSTWSLHAQAGAADNTLPLSQQFSFGGQNSFFGLRENEFRGRQILTTSLEYRYKLPFQIFFDTYIKARYDIGSIWEKREQIRLKDLRHGIGATLSINTPIGPADFSVGKSFYLKNTLSNNTLVWGPTFFYFTIGYYY